MTQFECQLFVIHFWELKKELSADTRPQKKRVKIDDFLVVFINSYNWLNVNTILHNLSFKPLQVMHRIEQSTIGYIMKISS